MKRPSVSKSFLDDVRDTLFLMVDSLSQEEGDVEWE